MSTKPASKRSSSSPGLLGVKVLVTTASITAVVGGWAAFTVQQSQTAVADTALDPAEDPNQTTIDLPPIPTLVPEPSPVVSALLPSADVLSRSSYSVVNGPANQAAFPNGLTGAIPTGAVPAVVASAPGLPALVATPTAVAPLPGSGLPGDTAKGASKPPKPKAAPPKAAKSTKSGGKTHSSK